MFRIIWSQEPIPKDVGKSIFLAGPTPRSADVISWRPEALRILRKKDFDGIVFVPEFEDNSRGWEADFDKDAQIEWEWASLDAATCILFWVPRDLSKLPGLTTNVEFGFYVRSEKIVLGTPPTAEKMYYLKRLALRFGVPQETTLAKTIAKALEIVAKNLKAR